MKKVDSRRHGPEAAWITVLFLLLCAFSLKNPAQTGGAFDLSHNVIASGGGSSSDGAFRLDGTIGQGIAGTTSTGGSFALTGGFWVPNPLGPTAARVSLSGSVRNAFGRGIRAVVTLTSFDGQTITANTNVFGNFRFTEVESGRSYVISVSARRYTFTEPSRLVNVTDQITDANFVAAAQ